MDDSVITCKEIMESYGEETKAIPTNFNGKIAICKTQNFCFTYIFINYYSIIDSC